MTEEPMYTASRELPLPTAAEFETITTVLGIKPGFKVLFSKLGQRLLKDEDVATIIDAALVPPEESDCRYYKLTPEQLHATCRDALAYLAWERKTQIPPTAEEISRMRAFVGLEA